MKISYAITVCNEFDEISKLLNELIKDLKEQKRFDIDEIVVLFDSNNGTEEVKTFLSGFKKLKEIKLVNFKFKGHFADLKNKLTSVCEGDYIFQIDADELHHPDLVKVLPLVLQDNPTIDVFRVPRKNVVKGLTKEHLLKWGWNINAAGYVNFPDYQWRCYRNSSTIKWINKVHEVLTGYDEFGEFPPIKEFCLLHEKTIERQEKQNKYYNTLQ